MKSEDLTPVLEARPFRPFTVHTSDGRHHAVPTATFMAVHSTEPWVFVWNLSDRGYALINVDQIVRLEFEDDTE